MIILGASLDPHDTFVRGAEGAEDAEDAGVTVGATFKGSVAPIPITVFNSYPGGKPGTDVIPLPRFPLSVVIRKSKLLTSLPRCSKPTIFPVSTPSRLVQLIVSPIDIPIYL